VLANSVWRGTRAGMKRKELTNTQWERLQALLPPQKPPAGRPALAHRRLRNGIVWMLRTGARWRGWPERSGAWSTVASRCERWRTAGLWQRLCEAVPQQAAAAGKLNGAVHDGDGTGVRAPQHAAGVPRGAAAAA
jgi:transposase